MNTLVQALGQCRADIRERMVGYFTQADPEYGRRVAEGLAAYDKAGPATGQRDPGQAADEAARQGHKTDGY